MKKAENYFAHAALARNVQRVKTLEHRGAQYADSWALDAPTVYHDAAERIIAKCKPPKEQAARLRRLAGMNDAKLSRIQKGEFFEDNHDDLGNYNDAFCYAALELLNK